MVTIGTIIPCHNRKNTTVKCLESLKKIPTGKFFLQIYLIDDGSTDGTAQTVENQFKSKVKVLKGDGNLFWTGAINKGINQAIKDGCDYIHLMNDDINFNENFLFELYKASKQYPKAIIGSITCDVHNPQQVVRGGILLTDKKTTPWEEIKDVQLEDIKKKSVYAVDSLSGRSVLISSETIRNIGYFDNKHFPHAFADFDYFFRAKKHGYQIMVAPDSIIYTEIEPKFAERLLSQPRMAAIFDLWFNKNFSGIMTLWYLSKWAGRYSYYLGYQVARRIKWTILILFCRPEKLRQKLYRPTK